MYLILSFLLLPGVRSSIGFSSTSISRGPAFPNELPNASRDSRSCEKCRRPCRGTNLLSPPQLTDRRTNNELTNARKSLLYWLGFSNWPSWVELGELGPKVTNLGRFKFNLKIVLLLLCHMRTHRIMRICRIKRNVQQVYSIQYTFKQVYGILEVYPPKRSNSKVTNYISKDSHHDTKILCDIFDPLMYYAGMWCSPSPPLYPKSFLQNMEQFTKI